MFDSREQAEDFFEEYINDVDVLDIRCKKGDEVVHIDYCTCGIIELDDDENPILFYNKKNQIFLMETGPQVFLPPQELKNDIKNLNLTNKLIKKCKTLGKEQRRRYIELGKYCQECQPSNESSSDDDSDIENEIINIKEPVKEPVKELVKEPIKELVKEPVKELVKKPRTTKPRNTKSKNK
jgi:hypothetical protein